MPNPKSGESKQDYVSRFMSSEEAKRDYPDQKQRLAVAYSKWEAKKNMNPVKKSLGIINNNLNSVKKSLVNKAEEGDKRYIFGKPATYTSGKWVEDNPVKLPSENGEEQKQFIKPESSNIPTSETREQRRAFDEQEETEEQQNMRLRAEGLLKSCSENVKKSYSTINKNLAGVHDAMTRTGATTYADDHAHSYQIDRDGNGATTGIVGEYGVDHIHEIRNFEVSSAQEHEHMI